MNIDERDLSESELDAALSVGNADTRLAASLAHILAPPADLQRRTTSVVHDGLLARSTVDTAVGILSVGVQTLQLLFTTSSEEQSSR